MQKIQHEKAILNFNQLGPAVSRRAHKIAKQKKRASNPKPQVHAYPLAQHSYPRLLFQIPIGVFVLPPSIATKIDGLRAQNGYHRHLRGEAGRDPKATSRSWRKYLFFINLRSGHFSFKLNNFCLVKRNTYLIFEITHHNLFYFFLQLFSLSIEQQASSATEKICHRWTMSS